MTPAAHATDAEQQAQTRFLKSVQLGNWKAVKSASCAALRDDSRLMTRALMFTSESWRVAECASEELQADRDFVRKAVSRSTYSFLFASEALRSDREFVMALVSERDDVVEFASEKLRGDPDFMAKVMSLNSRAIEFATESLRSDRDFILVAISIDWKDALCFAASKFRADREVMLKAVCQDWEAINYASEALLADRDIMLTAVFRSWDALHCSSFARNDHQIVMVAVRQDTTALKCASERLRSNRDFMSEALLVDWRAIDYASEELRGDQSIQDLIIDAALGSNEQVIGLQVTMMSGRGCRQIWRASDTLSKVLWRCGRLLGLDAEEVARRGTFVRGTQIITNMYLLRHGVINELTLVLTDSTGQCMRHDVRH